MLLPAYTDMEVAIATKIACEPDAFWEDYMEAISTDIRKKVNFNMYRGKAGECALLASRPESLYTVRQNKKYSWKNSP